MTDRDDLHAYHRTMVSVYEAAALLHLRPSTAQRYCRNGLLPSIILGRARLISLAAIYRLLEAGTKAQRPDKIASPAPVQNPVQQAAPAPSTPAVPEPVRLFCASDVAYIRGYQTKLADPDRLVREDARWQLQMFYKSASARAESIPPASIDPESLRILESLKPVSPAPVPVVAPVRQEVSASAPAKPAAPKLPFKMDLAALTALAAASAPPEPEDYEQYQHRVQAEKLAALREAVKTASPELQAAFAGWETLKAG